MGGFNAVIIKAALPDGRQAVVHAEAIFDDDPFKRSSELMDAYGVSVCVCDLNPNSNDAIRFMNKHPGKVFLATYSDMADNLMRWSDQLDDSDRRTEEEARIRYSVTIDRYKLMQAALHRIKNSECLFPDPAGLEQEVMDGKERKRIHLLRDWIFLHFTKTALIWEINKKTGKGRPTVMKVGIDPHFAFANMFCEAAWARKNGLSTILMPEDPAPEETAALAEIESALPGLPAQVAEAMRAADAASNKSGKKTCGGCAHFEDGRCGLRHFSVREHEDACFTFEAA
ncbi:MAG: hypothetical protein E7K72_27515, partial [Roseomonas mucosa]|nr:hypothetical protein [Roseomonas mucosa]